LPKISVILPVYNSEKYLGEAIASILNQSFSDFELIILNDGSTDNSKNVIESFNDKRIVLVDQSNLGLAATLNRGIMMARGELIARQDNDDVSLPDRLEKQIEFLESNPHISLLGTAAEIIDESGKSTGRYHKHSTDSTVLKFNLLFNNPFVHSSIVFRRSVLGLVGDYSTDPLFFEDHNLWSRIARVSGVSNLNACLVKYRELTSSMSRSTQDYVKRVNRQSVNNILFYCPELQASHVELIVSYLCGAQIPVDYEAAYNKINAMLTKLTLAFATKEAVSREKLEQERVRQLFNFKRHYYNLLIQSSDVSFLKKIQMRVLRKILFMKHKNLV